MTADRTAGSAAVCKGKLKLRVLLAGHSVAMVTYRVMKLIPTCSLVIGQFFDTMIVASSDKDW